MQTRLERSITNKVVAGVCGGDMRRRRAKMLDPGRWIA